MYSDMFVMNSFISMVGFHVKCMGMFHDGYTRDKGPVPYKKTDFSLATRGRE